MDDLQFLTILQLLAVASFFVALLVVVLSLRRARLSQTHNRRFYVGSAVFAGVATLACLAVVAGYSGGLAVYAIYLGVVTVPVWLILRNLATDKARYSALDEPEQPREV